MNYYSNINCVDKIIDYHIIKYKTSQNAWLNFRRLFFLLHFGLERILPN